jgi:putative ABC transport system permease protein
MLKNYFTVALRNLLNQKFYSIIKVLGLAVGLASSILIALFVYEDLSYDGFNTKRDRIARVLTIDNAEGVKSKLVGITYPGFAPAIQRDVPEVVNSVRIFNQGRLPLRVGDNLLSSEGTYRTESSFFDVFDYKLLTGNTKGILDEPNSVVLTQSLAIKLFGKENPVGKAIQMNTTSLNVKGIMADPPKNSHLQFDMLGSITPTPSDSSYAQYLNSFNGISTHAYLLLDQPRDLQTIIPKLKQVADKNQGYQFFEPTLQYLSDIHLNSGEILFEQNYNKSDGSNLYVLSFVALLIILLAAVNFMNLVTAHAAGRAKEVGLRKVVGAMKEQLIGQHLLESVIVTAVSFIIAFALAILLLPVLNTVYQRYATFAPLLTPIAITGSLGLVLVLGLLAGSYPAFCFICFQASGGIERGFQKHQQRHPATADTGCAAIYHLHCFNGGYGYCVPANALYPE